MPDAPAPNHELGGCAHGTRPTDLGGESLIAGLTTSRISIVVDGSVFPSASEKNPTHTIMALAARAAEHIADRLRKGEL